MELTEVVRRRCRCRRRRHCRSRRSLHRLPRSCCGCPGRWPRNFGKRSDGRVAFQCQGSGDAGAEDAAKELAAAKDLDVGQILRKEGERACLLVWEGCESARVCERERERERERKGEKTATCAKRGRQVGAQLFVGRTRARKHENCIAGAGTGCALTSLPPRGKKSVSIA